MNTPQGNGYDAKKMLKSIVTRECDRILKDGKIGVDISLNDLCNSGRAKVRKLACQNLRIDWDDFQREAFGSYHPTNGDPFEGLVL